MNVGLSVAMKEKITCSRVNGRFDPQALINYRLDRSRESLKAAYLMFDDNKHS